ncbi:LOW QUALITY PROTEIN: lysophosphatidic acid receptor 6-like [Neosynchiropus ocellatus]
MSNSTIQEEKNLLYAGFYGCIMVLGFLLNAASLWILCRRHSLKSPSAVFMVNLALSDVLLAISLPLRVYFHATGTWPLGNVACVSTRMLFRYNLRTAVFITLISVDRLLAVVFPLRSRRLYFCTPHRNMSNSTIQEEKNLLYAGFYGCIMVLGFLLNAASLWILCRRHSLKSPSAVFMVSLALSDVLLTTSLPLRVYFHATGTWPLGNVACVSTIMLFRYNLRSGCIFITLISVDRLLAVVFPLRSRCVRTVSVAWKTAALIWVLLICASIPESVKLFGKLSNGTTCFEHHHDGRVCVYMVLLLSLLLVSIVSTVLVTWTLCRLDNSHIIKNRVNVIILFIMNIIMFVVFFLPLAIAQLSSKTLVKPLACLASANCCVDPLLYYFSFDGFWKRDRPASEASRT